MKRPRIFVIGPVPPPIHGQSIAVEQIINSGLSRNYEFILFNKSTLSAKIGDQGRFRVIKILRYSEFILKLYINLIQNPPSICYISLAQSRLGIIRDSIIMSICAKFSHVVIHLHGGAFRIQFDRLNIVEKWFARFALKRVSKAIILSECFGPIFDVLVLPSKIRIIRNGLPDFYNGVCPDGRSQGSNIHVLFLSNLEPEKGLWDVLASLGRLKSRNVPFTATIAGPFPNTKIRDQTLSIITDLGLEKYIELPGIVTGQVKASLFARADVFVFLPSQIEGQPLVIIEALMAGLPIVATDQGSISEMVVDQSNGFVVPVHDIESVVEKITLLSKYPHIRKEMGQKSRQRFIDEYTEEQYLAKMKMVFDDVLTAPRKQLEISDR